MFLWNPPPNTSVERNEVSVKRKEKYQACACVSQALLHEEVTSRRSLGWVSFGSEGGAACVKPPIFSPLAILSLKGKTKQSPRLTI